MPAPSSRPGRPAHRRPPQPGQLRPEPRRAANWMWRPEPPRRGPRHRLSPVGHLLAGCTSRPSAGSCWSEVRQGAMTRSCPARRRRLHDRRLEERLSRIRASSTTCERIRRHLPGRPPHRAIRSHAATPQEQARLRAEGRRDPQRVRVLLPAGGSRTIPRARARGARDPTGDPRTAHAIDLGAPPGRKIPTNYRSASGGGRSMTPRLPDCPLTPR